MTLAGDEGIPNLNGCAAIEAGGLAGRSPSAAGGDFNSADCASRAAATAMAGAGRSPSASGSTRGLVAIFANP
jgi:hypothetical protein